jgi:predicted nucleic-acid-binding Zn-ribbon protein
MANHDTKEVLSFISAKWGNRNCPMCGEGTWEVQEKTFQLSEFHHGNLAVGGPLVPVIPVTCTNCGNTVLVNAIISGAISPEADKKGEK